MTKIKKKGKKTKVKKKTVYKKIITIKACSYTCKKAYNKTYVFGITAINKKVKGKRKTIKVKVLGYDKTKVENTNSQNKNTDQNTNQDENTDEEEEDQSSNKKKKNNRNSNTETQKPQEEVPLYIPATLSVKVDESATLTAQGKNIRYYVTDPSYVKLSDESDSGVTVKGLTSGTTTLVAQSGSS